MRAAYGSICARKPIVGEKGIRSVQLNSAPRQPLSETIIRLLKRRRHFLLLGQDQGEISSSTYVNAYI